MELNIETAPQIFVCKINAMQWENVPNERYVILSNNNR